MMLLTVSNDAHGVKLGILFIQKGSNLDMCGNTPKGITDSCFIVSEW